ncbi:MAG: ATP synthase F1 subunit delta [Oscillospiraceae bacterium]|nr:ATP synthase F1 subunit delta [Oscillospiraceae bacterium]
MTTAAQQYGQALYELARDEQVSQPILEQMQSLVAAFREESDFLRLLASPNLPKEERCQILDDSFRGEIHPYLLNFLKILTREGLAGKFPDCCKHYQSLYYTDHDILPVRVYTAQALTLQQEKQLTEKLESITGKSVLLQKHIQPDCLGGVRIVYNGKQVDGTVKSRLDAVGKLLKNTVV